MIQSHRALRAYCTASIFVYVRNLQKEPRKMYKALGLQAQVTELTS